MKTCPTCNQQFVDDDLSFCTSCGTPLASSSQSADFDPNKTLLSPPPRDTAPPSPYTEPRSFNDPTLQQVRPLSEQPNVNRPFAEPPQQQGWQSGQQQAPFQPLFPSRTPAFGQQSQPEWTPPPPPVQSWGNNPNAVNYAGVSQGPQQGLALASLITGIASCTIGLCCSIGILTSPVAIILGIVALVQIKNEPMKYTGKGMAIGGIATGVLYFVIFILLLLLNIGISILPILLGN